jgi:hypothetical protein
MRKIVVIALLVGMMLVSGCIGQTPQPAQQVQAPDVSPQEFISDLGDLKADINEVGEALKTE